MKNKGTVKTLIPLVTIPSYYVQGITDRGTTEMELPQGVDKDDLRMTVELSGGHHLFIQHGQHITFLNNGDLQVLTYVDSA